MRIRAIIAVMFVVLVLSVAFNYGTFRSRNNSRINGGNDASFSTYNDSVILTVDGCLLWQDEKQRTQDFHQYWKIRATIDRRHSDCNILDVWEHNTGVIIPQPEECKVTHLDADAKTATISYKDATITINRDRTIWTTKDPREKGGGELVRCWDRRINWYPW